MRRPFFSVIIPTKNRSFLVGNAIRSVLEQGFADLELVLVDNDDTPETGKLAAGIADPRLQYLRTGGLTMPDNWEAGYARATGEWLLLLEDKSLLKPRALTTLRDAIARDGPGVISWPQDIFNDLLTPPRIIPAGGRGGTVAYPSEEVIRRYLDQPRAEADRILPRGLNSCMSRAIYQAILEGPVGRVCPPNSPDYTIAFLQLAASDYLLHVDEALTVFGSCYHSQGRRSIVKADSAADLAKNISADAGRYFDLVPVKLNLIGNLLYNDYLHVRALVGGRLEQFPLNRVNYFLECYRDLEVSRRFGVDMTTEQAACDAALAREDEGVRRAVAEALSAVPPLWKRIAKGLGLQRFHRQWLQWREARSALPLFATAVEYVAWEARRRRN